MKLVREYIELPPKSKEQILRDIKNAPKEQLNKILLNSCADGDINKIIMLLDNGADINCQDNIGFTPLIYAINYAHKNVIKLLIERGADVNKTSYSGSTPLMKSIHTGYIDIVELLLDKGANINDLSKGGWSALKIAAQHGFEKIHLLLKSRGAKE